MELSPRSNAPSPGHAVVVGGGPAGNLMALYLAQQDWTVAVYERRSAPDRSPNKPDLQPQRGTYNIVLSARGQAALQAAGVTIPAERAVVLQGSVRHSHKGAKQQTSLSTSVSIQRNTLAQLLWEQAKAQYPDKITFYFDQCLDRIDFAQKIAHFQPNLAEEVPADAASPAPSPPPAPRTAPFDLLVGADGVFSTVRQQLAEVEPGFEYHQNQDQMQFKVCDLGAGEDLPGGKPEWGQYFHVWPKVQPLSLLAPPSADGSLKGVLILPAQGEFTFDRLTEPKAIQRLFQTKFPDVFGDREIPDAFITDFIQQKAAFGGITTTCSQFHGQDGIVLLGDAAHSVWPSLGQGCNVALESCRVLAEHLAQHQGNWHTALPAFSQARKPDTDAAGRLSEQGFGGNRRAGNFLFLSRIIALSILHKLSPALFTKPALTQMGQAEVSYGTILAQWQAQTRNLQIILTLSAIILLILLENILLS